MSQSTVSNRAMNSEREGTGANDLQDRPSTSPGTPPGPSHSKVKIDESHLAVSYAHFCRVTGTPEELIIDFRLNPHPFNAHDQVVPVGQRIVMNYYTTKRLLQAISLSLQRHESVFGPLETDVRQRVLPRANVQSNASDDHTVSIRQPTMKPTSVSTASSSFFNSVGCAAINAVSVPCEFAAM